MIRSPRFFVLPFVAAALLVPSAAVAEEAVTTLKPITVHGRPARPAVVIEIKRAEPNLGLKPLTPPKSFFSENQ